MGRKFKAPRGTFDVLPAEGLRRRELIRLTAEVLGRAGYESIATPVFEDTELFARGVGASSEIVQKEMFTFSDPGGRSLTLRPEGTAGICRAYVEAGMHKLPQPVKLLYLGPFFRHEAPQAGRFRQFHQVGIEAIGSDEPSLDAEAILLLEELLASAGASGLRLRLSSLGGPESRRAYVEELRAWLRARSDELPEALRARVEANPMRAFDAKDERTRAVMSEAPTLLERLADDDAEHFSEVRSLLDGAGLEYRLDPTLVRGLDYYTRTVFEFESDQLGAQSGVGGGGRYDGLVEELGGPRAPGVGWAAGIERILLASDARGPDVVPPVFVALEDGSSAGAREGFLLARDLRTRGLSAQMEQSGRSLKGQLKHADRLGARWVAIVAGEEIRVRDMASGDQRAAATRAEALDLVLAGAAR